MRIRTSKVQPTDTTGEKVRASADGHQVTVPWDYSLNEEDMHAYAARTLAQRLTESYAAPNVRQVGDHARGYVYETE